MQLLSVIRSPFVLSVLGVLAFIAACWYALRRLEQTSLYYPEKQFSAVPSSAGLPFEDVIMNTADGKRIHGWFIPVQPSASAFPKPLCVLLSHGNAGTMGDRLEKATLLHRMGLNVFLYDYRGFGRSEGIPSEHGTYLDGEAAYRYLTKERQIAPEHIFIYGESLGTAISAELAMRFQAAGLILESPFTSVVEMTELLYPWLPADLVVRYRYDTLSKMPKIKMPVMVMHSRADETIPYNMSEKVHAAANDPKEFFELHGGHNDGFSLTEGYSDVVRNFVRRWS